MKRSRQREAIMSYLKSVKSHPTADMVYENVRREISNISLGTVYRNLNQLAELGDIMKLNLDGKTDRFDANPNEHYHVECIKCGRVMDLEPDMQTLTHIDVLANNSFQGKILSHKVSFTGICKECLSTEGKDIDNNEAKN